MCANVFEVFLSYKEISDNSENTKNEVLWTNNEGLKLLKGFFRIIKSEIGEVVDTMNVDKDNEFKRFLSILFNRSISRLDSDIEKNIMKFIEKLKRFNFYSGIFNINDVLRDLKLLREHRIKFWESLLEDFRKNEALYIKELEKLNHLWEKNSGLLNSSKLQKKV
ncbi:MAG: hypothetical protein EU529_16185 [Promethearchaeota archaeon]|nr:MAG: hypothetical protein EU529_16185 [Candidatus Lokiarchaeota archaeon]